MFASFKAEPRRAVLCTFDTEDVNSWLILQSKYINISKLSPLIFVSW